jgi:Protein of unknown function (DUF2934)
MAKRTTPRAESDDAPAAPPPRAKSRRVRANTSPEADTIGAYPGIERTEGDGTVGQAIAAPSGASKSGPSPSEDDIRERAYQRYLERGGHQGNEFDDWVEAERELKRGR